MTSKVFEKSFNKSVSSLLPNALLKPCLSIALVNNSVFSSSVKISLSDALVKGI